MPGETRAKSAGNQTVKVTTFPLGVVTFGRGAPCPWLAPVVLGSGRSAGQEAERILLCFEGGDECLDLRLRDRVGIDDLEMHPCG